MLRKRGYDIVHYHPTTDDDYKKIRLLKHYQIETVLDVGANVGKYGVELRSLGFEGEIISFEPLSEAFSKLKEKAEQDDHWNALNYALGSKDETAEINIASNSLSSSLRDMLPSHLNSAPESKDIGKETIKVKKLDSVFEEICPDQEHVLLKIDTQGFEKKVIDGAEASLETIDTVQLEMSLTPLYKGETLFVDMLNLLKDKGYSLVHLEHVFSDIKTGRLLQVDGMFHRFS